MTQASAHAPLRQTPLHRLHVELGARMVPFAGYEMPVQFKQGILHEHLHTRSAAGLFDVSHMGQLILRPRSGSVRDVALDLEGLVPADILGLAEGRQRYALFTNPAGGILDDLMVTNRGDHLFLVVNAACKEADEAHLRAHLKDSVSRTGRSGASRVARAGCAIRARPVGAGRRRHALYGQPCYFAARC